jgi:hypothetical protein
VIKKRFKDSDVYIVLILAGDIRMQEHRYIMAEYVGRDLQKDEYVHHINGVRDDNRLENLMLVDYVKHQQLHGKMKDGVRKYHAPKLPPPVVEMTNEIFWVRPGEKKQKQIVGFYFPKPQ